MANNHGYTDQQWYGSEFGGITEPTRNTVQPKGRDSLTAAEELRLLRTTGDLSDTIQQTPMSLEDRRQMLGLKPAGNTRPNWLGNTGRRPYAADYPFPYGVEYPEAEEDTGDVP